MPGRGFAKNLASRCGSLPGGRGRSLGPRPSFPSPSRVTFRSWRLSRPPPCGSLSQNLFFRPPSPRALGQTRKSPGADPLALGQTRKSPSHSLGHFPTSPSHSLGHFPTAVEASSHSLPELSSGFNSPQNGKTHKMAEI